MSDGDFKRAIDDLTTDRRVYLGDSVYADFNGDIIRLTTNNGYPDDPRNEILLEPNVYDALVRYAARVWKIEEPPAL